MIGRNGAGVVVSGVVPASSPSTADRPGADMTTARVTAPRSSTMLLGGTALVVGALLSVIAQLAGPTGGPTGPSGQASFAMLGGAATFMAAFVLGFGDGGAWDAVRGSWIGRVSFAVFGGAGLLVGVVPLLPSPPIASAGVVEAGLMVTAGAAAVTAAVVVRRVAATPRRISVVVAAIGAATAASGLLALAPSTGHLAPFAAVAAGLLQAAVGAVVLRQRRRKGRPVP
ncbi:hypothetical protein DEI92_09865 [Curtobacterium sp. MCBD17_034]|nr:hypothetical protein DEI86_02620 [Curtobacterium sp. MCBD17_028]PZF59282.1 hypothetical protein DEI92_09865 [Curtobacterium sp. MCBD17_034]PZM34178.1 hypothetical protein DEI90_08270 [Curtobacterium sp. MCBD17_031]